MGAGGTGALVRMGGAISGAPGWTVSTGGPALVVLRAGGAGARGVCGWVGAAAGAWSGAAGGAAGSGGAAVRTGGAEAGRSSR